MRQEVDVLTLSATPIPRTLHMSLVGVRDMSTMETPPEARLPVKTYVAEYNDHLVREAVLRELERNGQIFFLHNRVQSIAMVAANLQELVPEARIAASGAALWTTRLRSTPTPSRSTSTMSPVSWSNVCSAPTCFRSVSGITDRSSMPNERSWR